MRWRDLIKKEKKEKSRGRDERRMGVRAVGMV